MPGGSQITGAVRGLTAVGLLMLVVLHPQLPLKVISLVTKTVTGVLGLATGPKIGG